MNYPNRESVVDYLARYDRLLEVGIGRRTDVAEALVAAGKTVTATDVSPCDVPPGVRFVVDDVVARSTTTGEPGTGRNRGSLYAVDAVYGLNLPPELHRPTRDVAHAAGAGFLFTTLGGDQPAVPVDRVTLADETLYVARAP